MDAVQQQDALETQVRRGWEIAERLTDLGIAAREQRDALKQTIGALCDVVVPAAQEQGKRRHVAELRAMLSSVDKVIAFLDTVQP